MMGVNYDLFWTLNPKSLTPFIKAFDLKKKYDDEIAWTNGIYIQRAVASCLNGAKSKYPDKPRMAKSIEKNVVMTPKQIKEKMFTQMKIINSRFGKEN